MKHRHYCSGKYEEVLLGLTCHCYFFPNLFIQIQYTYATIIHDTINGTVSYIPKLSWSPNFANFVSEVFSYKNFLGKLLSSTKLHNCAKKQSVRSMILESVDSNPSRTFIQLFYTLIKKLTFKQ